MPSIPRPPRLEAAAGVVLQALRGRDVAPFAAAFRADPGLGGAIGAEADPGERAVRRLVAGQAIARARGLRVDLAVTRAGGFVGSVGLHGFAWEHARAEVGVWLVPAARGRGIATAAVVRLAEWALGDLALERLELVTAPDNRAARALAARAGFAAEEHRPAPGGGEQIVHARVAVRG